MLKYRKKPVVIEAMQFFNGDGKNTINEVLKFIGDKGKLDDCYDMHNNLTCRLIIHTLEGDHIARDSDYIIKGVAGEFYSCKKEIFEQTYELVGEKTPC